MKKYRCIKDLIKEIMDENCSLKAQKIIDDDKIRRLEKEIEGSKDPEYDEVISRFVDKIGGRNMIRI